MGYEITYPVGHTLRNAEILAVLSEQYPDKVFQVQHDGTISESYRTQPDFQAMLENSPWYRVRMAAATRVVAMSEVDPNDDYIRRVMSNDV